MRVRLQPWAGAPPLAGLLLAGGASRRMGRDKALLRVGGMTLAERGTRLLATFCDRVLVASGDGTRLAWLGVPQVADVQAGSGPLSGLVAGLEAARCDLVAVLAVDMPDADAMVFRMLAERWRGEPAVVPVVDGRSQPLHAVWAASAAAALRDRLAAGERSVVAAAEALGAATVAAEGTFARNLNRPEDLQDRGNVSII